MSAFVRDVLGLASRRGGRVDFSVLPDGSSLAVQATPVPPWS